METNEIKKRITELFNFQANNVTPFEDNEQAEMMTAVAKNIPGAAPAGFELSKGDSVYRYFVEDRVGQLFLKFNSSISSIVNDAVDNRDITFAYDRAGIPVLKL
jgi:hypothetical protein